MNVYDIIKSPIITEKAEVLRARNIYAFRVDLRANKTLVKLAIKKIYGITPDKVNIVTNLPKEKRNRNKIGYSPRTKKAYVFLNKKDKIEIFEGT